MISYLSLIPLFIWMNLFYLSNITKIDIRFHQIDLSKSNKTLILFYITKILYWMWIIFGIYLKLYTPVLILISLTIVKFLSYRFSTKLYKISNLITPIISIVLMTLIVLTYFLNIKLISLLITI
jgi:hypothetical protein